MAEEKLEFKLGAYSLGINVVSLAVAAVFVYFDRVILGLIAFLVTSSLLLAAIYRREKPVNPGKQSDDVE